MISTLPISITSEALKQVKIILDKKSIPAKYGLRIGISNAVSCGATSFILGFDEKKTSDDSFQVAGIEVLISKKELLHIIGLTLDYEVGKKAAGFKFNK